MSSWKAFSILFSGQKALQGVCTQKRLPKVKEVPRLRYGAPRVKSPCVWVDVLSSITCIKFSLESRLLQSTSVKHMWRDGIPGLTQMSLHASKRGSDQSQDLVCSMTVDG